MTDEETPAVEEIRRHRELEVYQMAFEPVVSLSNGRELYATYDSIPTASRGEPRKLVTMIRSPQHWIIGQ